MFCAMEEQKLGKKSGREGKKGGGEIPEKEGDLGKQMCGRICALVLKPPAGELCSEQPFLLQSCPL